MAEKLDPKEVATFEELLMTVLYEQEALRRVLVRKGLLTNEEVLMVGSSILVSTHGTGAGMEDFDYAWSIAVLRATSNLDNPWCDQEPRIRLS